MGIAALATIGVAGADPVGKGPGVIVILTTIALVLCVRERQAVGAGVAVGTTGLVIGLLVSVTLVASDSRGVETARRATPELGTPTTTAATGTTLLTGDDVPAEVLQATVVRDEAAPDSNAAPDTTAAPAGPGSEQERLVRCEGALALITDTLRSSAPQLAVPARPVDGSADAATRVDACEAALGALAAALGR